MKMCVVSNKILSEWSRGDEWRVADSPLGVHGHLMSPMGFLVCTIGSLKCDMEFPAWIEGQVQDVA